MNYIKEYRSALKVSLAIFAYSFIMWIILAIFMYCDYHNIVFTYANTLSVLLNFHVSMLFELFRGSAHHRDSSPILLYLLLPIVSFLVNFPLLILESIVARWICGKFNKIVSNNSRTMTVILSLSVLIAVSTIIGIIAINSRSLNGDGTGYYDELPFSIEHIKNSNIEEAKHFIKYAKRLNDDEIKAMLDRIKNITLTSNEYIYKGKGMRIQCHIYKTKDGPIMILATLNGIFSKLLIGIDSLDGSGLENDELCNIEYKNFVKDYNGLKDEMTK